MPVSPARFPVGRPLLVALCVVAASWSSAAAGTSSAVELRSGPLAVSIRVAQKRFEITVVDQRTHRRWISISEKSAGDSPQLQQLDSSRASVAFVDRKTRLPVRGEISVLPEGELAFSLSTRDTSAPFKDVVFPAAFKAADLASQGRLLFCDRSAGLRLPIEDCGWYKNKVLTCYANTTTLDMPWIGIEDAQRGDGYMLIFDTPADASVKLTADASGRCWPDSLWFESRGTLGYDRRAVVRFLDQGGYVAQALAYRQRAQREGKVVPLRQRAASRPGMMRMPGAAIVWGIDDATFAIQAMQHGIRHGIFNGGSRLSAEDIREIVSLGYLTGEYDSYTDILEGPTGKQTDSIEKAAFRDKTGQPMAGWRTLEGLQYYTRSSALAKSAAEVIVPPVLQRFPMNARFLDVSATMSFWEDWHPDHMFDRRGDMANRLRLFQYIQSLGLVLGSEHPKAWSMPYIDYGEGNMSGPFWWNSNVGHLKPIHNRAEIDKLYLRYGCDPALRVPLWELVFHDTVMTTWYWGDSNGYLHSVAPELTQFKKLQNILCGTVPMMWANHLDFGWNRDRAGFLRTYREICRFVETVAFESITSHRSLTPDATLQESRFSNGAWAVVNFSSRPAAAPLPDGSSVTLAGYGYVAVAPSFRQSSVQEHGSTVTEITAPDFHYLQCDQPADRGVFAGQGHAALYRLSNTQWNLATSGGPWRVNLQPVASQSSGSALRVVRIDSNGRYLQEVPLSSASPSVLELPAQGSSSATSESEMLYAILPRASPYSVLFIPNSGAVPEATSVSLSVAAAEGIDIRYTLDGNPPTSSSRLYTAPIALDRPTTLTAQAFRSGVALGSPVIAPYSVVRPLVRTPTLMGGAKPADVTCDISGLTELTIEVNDAGDSMDFDSGVLGEPTLVAADGQLTPLTALQPFSVINGGEDTVHNSQDLRLGGRPLPFGMSLHPVARLRYKLDKPYASFRAQLGVSDKTSGKGSVQFVISGKR